MDLQGKRVLVTGAARGVGLALALHLADRGAKVLGADLTPESAELERARVDLIRADVSSEEDTAAMAAFARESLGGLDALVNNAGLVALERRPFWEIPAQEWDRVLSVNVVGPWLCAKAALPLLREAGSGAIVNLASEVAFTGSPGLAHYVSSKGALVSLTRLMARELGPDRIRVNAVAPGYIPTEGARDLAPEGGYDASSTPLGRVGEPQDLLGALSFLLSDESAFVTGQTLLVNGGRLMR
jgi:NAD(P)-dependent dehydrogenase (short-subunit alcohol dehydrogenase family)